MNWRVTGFALQSTGMDLPLRPTSTGIESTDERSMNPGPCASPGEPCRLGCFHCGCSWPGFGHELCGCKAQKKRPLLVQPYHTMSYHVIPCHTMSYHVIPCHTMSYLVIPCHTLSYHITWIDHVNCIKHTKSPNNIQQQPWPLSLRHLRTGESRFCSPNRWKKRLTLTNNV